MIPPESYQNLSSEARIQSVSLKKFVPRDLEDEKSNRKFLKIWLTLYKSTCKKKSRCPKTQIWSMSWHFGAKKWYSGAKIRDMPIPELILRRWGGFRGCRFFFARTFVWSWPDFQEFWIPLLIFEISRAKLFAMALLVFEPNSWFQITEATSSLEPLGSSYCWRVPPWLLLSW